MPRPKKKPGATATTPQQAAIVTWSGANQTDKQAVVEAFAKAICDTQQPTNERAVASNSFFNVTGSPSISVRDSFDRQDYDDFRDEERLPKTAKEAMRQAMAAYNEHGIIRNVIDLMTDFAVKGIDLEHPSDDAKRFYKEWFRRVDGYERSAAFLKQLFLCNNVIVRRHTAKVPKPVLKKWKKTQASPDYQTPPPDPKPATSEIPLRFTFLNPLTIELLDETVATFVGPEQFRFCINVPPLVANRVRNPRTQQDRDLVAALPPDITNALRTGNRIELDKEKVSTFYYKRDDWEPWAMPFMKPIMADLHMLSKMKLADISALDGAISNIRVWKLGNVEAGIYPPASVIQYLAEILANNVGGGVMDLVWGPDIELMETSTEVHRFLGEGKYAPTLNAIFQGLGVPATLNGTGARPGSGYTNNYMSLQTFVERLEYARMVLRKFWEGEVRRVQVAMNHRKPASVVFDGLLTDEATIMQMYVNMADRDLISTESLQEMLNIVPEIERIRLRKEMRARDDKRMPPKAGPFHDANLDQGLWKILAQSNQYTPEELGLESDVPGINDEPPAERGAKITKKYTPKPVVAPGAGPGGAAPGQTKTKGKPGEGRPDGSKDSQKRTQKKMKPKTGKPTTAFVQSIARAQSQLSEIGKIATPMYLQAIGKKTAREMTVEEAANMESFRFAALCSYPLTEMPTQQNLQERCQAGSLQVPVFAADLLQQTIKQHMQEYGKEPTTDMVRAYMAGIHAIRNQDESQET